MLHVLEKCFAPQFKQGNWKTQLQKMIPSYGKDLSTDAQLLETVRARATKYLKV